MSQEIEKSEVVRVVHASKRPRAPNFNMSEIHILLDLVKKYKNILENKQTDGVTINEKNVAWEKLTNEFNANATTYSRTTKSLQGCYLTQKKKVKKASSEAKMSLPAPTINRDILVDSVQEIGTDWEVVSETIGCTPQSCEDTFNEIVIETKKEEKEHKKEISKTGGGGPAKQPSQICEKVKAILGPSVDGMYTMYDNDSEFIQEQQLLLPEEEREQPIEVINAMPVVEEFSRKTLKRKIDDSLEPSDKKTASSRRRPQEKRNVSSHFIELSKAKLELVEIQKEIAKSELQEKIKQSQHNDRIRTIEIQIKEIELKALSVKYQQFL